MDVKSKVVLITGAKRIGAEVACELARRGADIALTYCRARTETERTVETIRALGQRAIALPADLRSPELCRRAVQGTIEALDRLDVLIAMASVYAQTPFEALHEDDWCTSLSVDLSASFYCAYAAARHMQQRGQGGRILLVADSEAASGRPHHRGHLPHFVAKSAVIALAKALALELASDGILVNTLALGPILPDERASETDNQAIARATPLGRWGNPLEVARTAIAVIEREYMTGEIVRIDGGRHLV